MTWAIDIEIQLAKMFHWSLRDIDLTDVSSLIPFVLRLAEKSGGGESQPSGEGPLVFCDQVDFM